MSDGNIIRSKNHTVTIEKGSKNAKGRSAHMEEWLDPIDGAPGTHEEDQVFLSQVHNNQGDQVEGGSPANAPVGEIRTAAQKMADLNSQMRSVNDSLDEFQNSSGSVSAATPSLSGGATAPNLQNVNSTGVGSNLQQVNSTESLSDNKAALPGTGQTGPNIQGTGADAISTSKATLPGADSKGANIQGVGADTVTDSKAALPPDVSARPRLKGAAAMDALKEAKARLAQAGLTNSNVQEVSESDAHTDDNVSLPPNAGLGQNVQNVPGSPNNGVNRTTLDADNSSKNVQDINGPGGRGANLATLSDDSSKDNLAKLPPGAAKTSRAGVPNESQGASHNQSVDSGALKDNLAQVPGAKGLSDNLAQIDADNTGNHREGVDEAASRDNRANVPGAQAAAANRAALAKDGVSPATSGVTNSGHLQDNLQGAPVGGVNSNHANVDDSAQDDNLAQLPPGSGIQDNTAQIGRDAPKSNHQGVDAPAQFDNHAEVEESTQAANRQGLETEAALSNQATLPADAPSNNQLGVHQDGLDSNTAAVPNRSHQDNNAAIANEGHRDNIAEIAKGIHSSNVADVEQLQVGVHRETLPDAALGGVKHGSDTQGLGLGQPHERGDDGGGKIHQTHFSPPSHSSPSGLQDGPSHGASAFSMGQGTRVAQAGAVASTKVAKSTNKSRTNAGSAAGRPKEVPKASDTWSEAFRGRVAAINDQVKSLNHKLDEFDK